MCSTSRLLRRMSRSGDIPDHWPTRGWSRLADDRLDARPQHLRRAGFVEQASSEAVIRLPSRREKKMLGTHKRMIARGGDLGGISK